MFTSRKRSKILTSIFMIFDSFCRDLFSRHCFCCNLLALYSPVGDQTCVFFFRCNIICIRYQEGFAFILFFCWLHKIKMETIHKLTVRWSCCSPIIITEVSLNEGKVSKICGGSFFRIEFGRETKEEVELLGTIGSKMTGNVCWIVFLFITFSVQWRDREMEKWFQFSNLDLYYGFSEIWILIDFDFWKMYLFKYFFA